MAIALVQKKGAQSGASVASLAVTLDAPPTPGNLLVACCNSDATIATPAGFTLAVSAVLASGLYIFYRVVQGGDGSTVTFTPSVSDSVAAGVLEYSGLLTASVLDQTASNASNSGSSITTGITGATSQAAELAIAVAGPHSVGAPWTLSSWTAGYTSQITEGNALGLDNAGCFIADQVLGATGTQAATATFTGTFSNGGGGIATFKAAPLSLTATGLAATTGSAALNIVVTFAATGLAATTGTAALNVKAVLTATGLAATTGSAALGVLWSLAATGLAATTGSAALSQWHALSATGLAATTGTAAMTMKWSLAAIGLASTSGSMNVGLPVPMAATGLAATTGSFAFTSATPYIPGPTKVSLGPSNWPTKVAT